MILSKRKWVSINKIKKHQLRRRIKISTKCWTKLIKQWNRQTINLLKRYHNKYMILNPDSEEQACTNIKGYQSQVPIGILEDLLNKKISNWIPLWEVKDSIRIIRLIIPSKRQIEVRRILNIWTSVHSKITTFQTNNQQTWILKWFFKTSNTST